MSELCSDDDHFMVIKFEEGLWGNARDKRDRHGDDDQSRPIMIYYFT